MCEVFFFIFLSGLYTRGHLEGVSMFTMLAFVSFDGNTEFFVFAVTCEFVAMFDLKKTENLYLLGYRRANDSPFSRDTLRERMRHDIRTPRTNATHDANLLWRFSHLSDPTTWMSRNIPTLHLRITRYLRWFFHVLFSHKLATHYT